MLGQIFCMITLDKLIDVREGNSVCPHSIQTKKQSEDAFSVLCIIYF